MISRFCAIVTLGLCGLALSVRADGDDITSLKNRLFYESGISPSETYDLMKRLYEIFMSNRSPDDDEDMGQELRNFLEANNITKEKCDASSFFRLNSYLNDVELEEDNLRRYMQDCIDRQFALCKPLFAAKLEISANQLTQEDKQRAELLINKLEDAQGGVDFNAVSFDMDKAQDQFYEGILDFMESVMAHQRGELDVDNGRAKFSQQFNEIVGDLCQRVNRALEPAMQIYKLFNPLENMDPKSDKSSLFWIQIDTVCEEITHPDTPYTALDGVFMKLTKRY